MWASAANADGVIVPQSATGNLANVVTGAEEELAQDRAIMSAATEEAHAVHEATLEAEAQASRTSHRRMSVGLLPIQSPAPLPPSGSPSGSQRPQFAESGTASGWWASAGAVRAPRRGQLLPAAAAAMLDMSQSPRDSIAARGGSEPEDGGVRGRGDVRLRGAGIMRFPAHTTEGALAAEGSMAPGAGVSFTDSKSLFDEAVGGGAESQRGTVMGTPLGPELRKSTLRSGQARAPLSVEDTGDSQQWLLHRNSQTRTSPRPQPAVSLVSRAGGSDAASFGARIGSGALASKGLASVAPSSMVSGRAGPQPSREVARILQDTMRKQHEAAAQKRVRELRKAEVERRRALTISRHLQRQVEQAEEKVRDAARMEAARATRKARQDARFTGLMGSIDTGVAMCKQLGRDVLDKHDEARRRQQQEIHSQWQTGVYERLQTAIATEVDRVPAAVRRQELLEQSEAYNREAEHGAVFVDSSGGGKTGYNPFKHIRAPVAIRGGRIRDPVKTGIERERREAALTLQARLPAAAAIALGMSGAARRAGIPGDLSGAGRNQPSGSIGPRDGNLSRTAFDVALSRPGGVGPAASAMKAVRLPPRHDAPAGSTSVLFVPARLPTAPFPSAHGGLSGQGQDSTSHHRRRTTIGGTTRRPQSGASVRSSASRGSQTRPNRPPSAHSAARALLRAEQGAIGIVAATVQRAMGAQGKHMSDEEAIEIERVVRQTKSQGGVETRWTLPAGVWTSGLIEDMPFVRNWPLPGDPRTRTSDAAKGRGPTLGRKHDIVAAAVAEGEVAAAKSRERVLPSYFDAAERDHGTATSMAKAELGRPGRRTVQHPSAAKRSIQDLLPVGMGQLDEDA